VSIHATAIVERGAQVAPTADIGPFAVIGPHVEIGAGTRVGAHAVIDGHTRIGQDNVIFHHASVGAVPQDLKYAGEPTRLDIGNGNTVREFATLHLGTAAGGGITRVGDQNLFMAYSHVAHDCTVGSRCVFANGATLAGHVQVADAVILGGLSAVHQFTRVGKHAFIAGGTIVVMDIPPFCSAQGDRAELMGLNTVGLGRSGFSETRIGEIKDAYRILFRSKLTLVDALKQLKSELPTNADVAELIQFIEASSRGITR
jgi:UDP-N-acetylglucosamine acyltransferase